MRSTSSLRVILFTDLAGSTDLKRRLGDRGSAELIAQHDTLFRTILAASRGKENDNAGDGFSAFFERPSDAVRCAIDFQLSLRTMDAPERLAARVAVHMGEVVELPGGRADGIAAKLVGLPIDTTARVNGLAMPGQILLTRGVFDSARQQLQSAADGSLFSWLAHGPYRIKGVEDPIEVFEVGLPGLSPLKPPPDTEKAFRAVAPGDDDTLGWRPAAGLTVPDTPGWKIERKLGDGGFGEVWLGRNEGLKDLRTFKFCFDPHHLRALKREMRLFRLMKETLGERDDIARMYEVRLTEPPYYLEMQYTEGGNIRNWVDARGGFSQVPMSTRLEVVAQIADALAAAHSVGVIHKDVKPSNVLVEDRSNLEVPPGTSHGSIRRKEIQIRLIDFGIAALVEGANVEMTAATTGDSARTLATAGGEPHPTTGTHLYMAPELHAGKHASIKTDVYSLGVLLYQLVVGDLFRPIGHGWEREIADDLLREDIASCVALDAKARLPSADLLSRNLRTLAERHAQRDAERLRHDREVRRHRLLRVSGVVVALVFVIALVSASFGIMASREKRRAETAQQRAETSQQRAEAAERATKRQAEETQAVSDFLNKDLILAVSPSTEKGKGVDVKMRDVLEVASNLIDAAGRPGGRFAKKPLIEASIRDTIGWTYYTLGLGARAEPHAARAVELRRRHERPEHPRTLNSMNTLANVYSDQGKYADAQRLHEQTLEMQRRVLGPEHRHTTWSMNNLAKAYRAQGKYADAQRLIEQTLEIKRRVLGPEHSDTLNSMNNLANNYRDQGKYADAQRLHEQTLEIRRRVRGAEHPDTLRSMINLGEAYSAQGQYADAQRLHEQTLEMQRRVLGPEHSDTLASMNNLAVAYYGQVKYADAQRLHEQTLEIRSRVLGPQHPDTLMSMKDLANAYREQGQCADAALLYEAALAARRKVSGPSHPETNRVRGNLIGLYLKQQRHDDARPLIDEQIPLLRAAADRQEASAIDLNDYARVLLTVEPAELRDAAAGLVYARRAVHASGGMDGAILDTLALAYDLTGDPRRAVETQEQAIGLLPPGDSPMRREMEASLARFSRAATTQSASAPASRTAGVPANAP